MKEALFIPISTAGTIIAQRVEQLSEESTARQRKALFRDISSIMKATRLVPKSASILEVGTGARSDGVVGLLAIYEIEEAHKEASGISGSMQLRQLNTTGS